MSVVGGEGGSGGGGVAGVGQTRWDGLILLTLGSTRGVPGDTRGNEPAPGSAAGEKEGAGLNPDALLCPSAGAPGVAEAGGPVGTEQTFGLS